MKPIKLFLYIITLMAMTSCDKNAVNRQNSLEKLEVGRSDVSTMSGVGDGIEAFYTFLQTQSNGSFGLVNFSSYRVAGLQSPVTSDRGHGNYEFNGAFYDDNQNIVPGGLVSFGPLSISSDPARGNMYLQNSFGGAAAAAAPAATPAPAFDPVTDYNSVAGQTLNFTLNPSTPGLPVSGSLYVPQRMSVKFGFENPNTDGGSSPPRQSPIMGNNFPRWGTTVNNTVGCELGWVADPLNTSGVVVTVEYDAENSKSVLPASPAGDRKRYVAFRVADNGRFIIPTTVYSTLFPGLDPRDGFSALVTVTVGRATYTMASNSADPARKYSVYAATVVEVPVYISVARSNGPR